jgi:hypothetical protein
MFAASSFVMIVTDTGGTGRHYTEWVLGFWVLGSEVRGSEVRGSGVLGF